MKKTIFRFTATALTISVIFFSCQKETNHPANSFKNNFSSFRLYDGGFPEGFEAGTKTSYTAADVTLTTGIWNLSDVLIGTSTSDRKVGTKSARIQNSGKLTMKFNLSNGASQVNVRHAKYGSESNSSWKLYYSTNSGMSWTQTGSTITTSSTTLNTATFQVNITGNIRFELRKSSGGKLNVDEFTVYDYGSAPTEDNNLEMGNPSGAVTDINSPDNYLQSKPQYILSYNNSKGEPNWVSWHLSLAWKGAALRCNCFSPDYGLPSSFFIATTSNYTGSGFDRGHMCPSEDRDLNNVDNAATFQMDNIVPQAPQNNQQTWANFENYCRTLLYQGNELYIISGGYGSGGTGSNGGVTYTISNGNINVPAHVWKVVVVLPLGTNDASRVSAQTRVIAIDLPNTQTVTAHTWDYYRTSVDNIESLTGYDFLSTVSTSIQSTVESTVDSVPVQ